MFGIRSAAEAREALIGCGPANSGQWQQALGLSWWPVGSTGTKMEERLDELRVGLHHKNECSACAGLSFVLVLQKEAK